jgi:alpha-beta hydrolase superfamily lysophospholipase
MMDMQFELIETADGVALELAYFEARKAGAPAVLCTHGVGNSFCTTPLWRVAQDLHAMGWGVAVINNRGHDWVAMNPLDRRWIGAAYERFEDGALDFKAGMQWLQQRGHRSIVISGHSLGALKAAYTQAFFPAQPVIALAMFSPPRLPDDKVWDWAAHENILARSRSLAAAGKGEELMLVDMPTNAPALRGLMSAQTYINKYGAEAATTALRYTDRIRVPVFLAAGTEEKPQLSFSAELEPALINAPSVTRVTIDGADHMYTGRHGAVARKFAAWLDSLRPGAENAA